MAHNSTHLERGVIDSAAAPSRPRPHTLVLAGMPIRRKTRKSDANGYLDGQFLVAMPAMTRQALRAVGDLHVRALRAGRHGSDRQPAGLRTSLFPSCWASSAFPAATMAGKASSPVSATWMCTWGGRSKRAAASCCTARTILLPTSRLPIDDGVSLTATVDILKAIAGGKGPDRAILALGYAGWRPGQLESEIQANGWLHCPPDLDLLFDPRPGSEISIGRCRRSASIPRIWSAKPGTPERSRYAVGAQAQGVQPAPACRAVQRVGEPLLPQSHLPAEPGSPG